MKKYGRTFHLPISPGATSDDIDASAAPLLDHLRELRTRIMYSIAAFGICFFIAYFVWNHIFNILSHPLCAVLADRGQECQLVLIKAQEGFFVALRISMWGGFAMAFPIVAYQLWRFVAPGLYRNEKSAFLPFLIASPVLFFIGAGFSHYVVTPIAMSFFLGFADAASLVATILPDVAAVQTGADVVDTGIDIVFQGKVNETLDISLKLVVAFGLCFQMPVLLTLLGKAGMVSSAGLIAVRKYAVVIILIVAAVVTPPDLMSQIILFGAVYPLYEVSIFLIRRIEARREADLRAEGLWDEDDEAEEPGK